MGGARECAEGGSESDEAFDVRSGGGESKARMAKSSQELTPGYIEQGAKQAPSSSDEVRQKLIILATARLVPCR